MIITNTMQIVKIPFGQIPQLSTNDRAYAGEDERLRPFYKYPVAIESFEQVIADKSKDATNRAVLCQVLEDQYATLEVSPELQSQLERLGEKNTFTVTTAHQPSLFTGPLYYIYKIVSAINLARQLNERYPNNHFVPVFVTGGEDHDFEEANHANVFGKLLEWESGEKGSVGAMSTTTLTAVLAQLKSFLGDSELAQSIFEKIETAYTKHALYSQATVALVNALFGEYGLVVLNMNNVALKRLFIPMIKKELLERSSFTLVNETADQMEAAGFKVQARPREINLFYLMPQIRERIVFEDGLYRVLNTDYQFTEAELMEEVEQHPERFSPNVIMRPLFQELILPNLAYIGGGGELAYWLERKKQFADFGLNFPMLIRRNSALWINKGMAKKRKKTGFEIEEIFADNASLIKTLVLRNAQQPLEFSAQRKQLDHIFSAYREAARQVDPSLEAAVSADQAKQLKLLDQLEGRLLRAEKQKNETAIKQLEGFKEKLFPGNGLQERKDNFLSFYLNYGDRFFETLFEALDPLDRRFVIIEEAIK